MIERQGFYQHMGVIQPEIIDSALEQFEDIEAQNAVRDLLAHLNEEDHLYHVLQNNNLTPEMNDTLGKLIDLAKCVINFRSIYSKLHEKTRVSENEAQELINSVRQLKNYMDLENGTLAQRLFSIMGVTPEEESVVFRLVQRTEDEEKRSEPNFAFIVKKILHLS